MTAKGADNPHDTQAASSWVLRFLPLIRADGLVLDLACGAGRHARACRDAGLRVLAVDRDLSRVGDREAKIELLEADLESGDPFVADGALGGRRFDGIVITNYLWRPLYPGLAAALSDGGVLIHETFMLGNEAFGRPSNPDFLLRPDELLSAYPGLAVVAFEQGVVSGPRPAAVQRLCARAGAPGPLPDTPRVPL